MTHSKSPQADRTTREKISKILPLLNSDSEGERLAAVEALRKLDLLGASAALQSDCQRHHPAPQSEDRVQTVRVKVIKNEEPCVQTVRVVVHESDGEAS
jgi:hypothetical protein